MVIKLSEKEKIPEKNQRKQTAFPAKLFINN
jgi:hypothetical protein